MALLHPRVMQAMGKAKLSSAWGAPIADAISPLLATVGQTSTKGRPTRGAQVMRHLPRPAALSTVHRACQMPHAERYLFSRYRHNGCWDTVAGPNGFALAQAAEKFPGQHGGASQQAKFAKPIGGFAQCVSHIA